MNDAVTLMPDPSLRLTAAFRTVAERMTGLGFVNPVLAVEAVGFAPWEGHWLGVMVTPWFMNLVLAERDPALWQPLGQGEKRRYRFPAGDYEFIGARDEAAGEYQLCSLFSPVLEFDDHTTARLVAELAREALFDVDNAEVGEMPVANLTPAAAPGPVAQLEKKLDQPLSKRDFLRGRFLAGGDDDRG
ncbi:MAG: [NiFe]-hydrogenase assembly chaperone HybE [Betaproteobacteria bacterium]